MTRWSKNGCAQYCRSCGVFAGCMLVCGCGLIPSSDSQQISGEGTVSVRLVNETFFIVDPRLILNGALQRTGPVGPAGEKTVGVDCAPDAVLTMDPILLISAANVQVSLNTPQLQQGIDYNCGDTVTIVYHQRVDGFLFVEVQTGALEAP